MQDTIWILVMQCFERNTWTYVKQRHLELWDHFRWKKNTQKNELTVAETPGCLPKPARSSINWYLRTSSDKTWSELAWFGRCFPSRSLMMQWPKRTRQHVSSFEHQHLVTFLLKRSYYQRLQRRQLFRDFVNPQNRSVINSSFAFDFFSFESKMLEMEWLRPQLWHLEVAVHLPCIVVRHQCNLWPCQLLPWLCLGRLHLSGPVCWILGSRGPLHFRSAILALCTGKL